MSKSVKYRLNNASEAEIAEHLLRCDADFVPPLSDRVERIDNYAKNIVSKAVRFEVWADDILVGLLAAYCNDQKTRIAFITNVSVLREWTGKGIASRLLQQCIEYMTASGMQRINLEVGCNNTPAIKLYEKSGFVVSKSHTHKAHAQFVSMSRYLKIGEEDESKCA